MAASLGRMFRSLRLPVFLDQTIYFRRSPFRCCSQNSKSNTPPSGEGHSDLSSEDVSLSGSSTSKVASPTEGALDKFAKVVDRVKKAQNVESDINGSKKASHEDSNESFASMLRRSKFVSLGEHKGRLVQGEIVEVMEDDLYIDFGGKFHCVCPRPKRNGERYHRGSQVVLSLQCMEMSSAFLGSDIHVTLLEADATLLGLTAAHRNKAQTRRNPGVSQPEQKV